jgi:hypothetical protein
VIYVGFKVGCRVQRESLSAMFNRKRAIFKRR